MTAADSCCWGADMCAIICRWVLMVFGDCTEPEFERGMADLMASVKAVPGASSDGLMMSGNARKWASKLYELYRGRDSAEMSECSSRVGCCMCCGAGIREFTSLCIKFDPSMDEAGVRRTFEVAGVQLALNQFGISKKQFNIWCGT